jgi:Prolipoprotein diacylglyceryl transferase
VLADRQWKLGGGRVFALYVAGYTLGRGWIEMLRIDPANHVFGLRINVLTSIVVFLGAVAFLLVKKLPRDGSTRPDPALLQGRPDSGTESSTGDDSSEGPSDGSNEELKSPT